VNTRQLQQGRKVLRLLLANVGMTDAAIAAELGITLAELKPVLGALYGQHRIDFAAGYAFLPATATAAQEVKAA
jgi:transcription initiation factor IIE alpha subunit